MILYVLFFSGHIAHYIQLNYPYMVCCFGKMICIGHYNAGKLGVLVSLIPFFLELGGWIVWYIIEAFWGGVLFVFFF